VTRRTTFWIVAVLALCALAGLWRWRTLHLADNLGVLVAGGDGGGLPRAAPALEGFDEHALQATAASALAQGASAILVTRHGHLVLEQYAHGAEDGTLVDGGGLDLPLLVVTSGIAVAQYGMPMPPPPLEVKRLAAGIEAATGKSYPVFFSRHVWQPLNAAPARWLSPGLRARATDWLRVAELLMHDGRFEGRQVVQVGWIAGRTSQLSGSDVQPPLAGGMMRLRGPGATRLWLVPGLDLAVLRVGPAPPRGSAVDESLARTIVNEVRDRPASGGSSLRDLVPAH
jgi:hypothetical protein